MQMHTITNEIDGRVVQTVVADFSEEVITGAALLDEEMPGWDDKIVLPELNVSSTMHCVLGQVFMEQFEGLPFAHLSRYYSTEHGNEHIGSPYTLGVVKMIGPVTLGIETETSRHGFSISDEQVDTAYEYHVKVHGTVKWGVGEWLYEELTHAWVALIEARRAGKRVEVSPVQINTVSDIVARLEDARV